MYIVTIHAAGLALMLLLLISFVSFAEPSIDIEGASGLIVKLGYTTITALPLGFILFYLALRDWEHAPWKRYLSA